MKRIFKNQVFLAGLVLACLLLAFYGRIIFSGHYIFTGTIQDITNIYGFFPWDTHNILELARGHFPLWNPYNGLGVPHLANMQSALFYPLNILKYIFGFWPVIDIFLLIRLWVAGLFTYLLARRVMKAGFFPGLLAGSAFMLSGYLTRYVYMSHVNVESLIPLQLWLFHRLAERGSPGRFIAAGVGVFCLVAGGFPEATLYAVVIGGLFYIFCGMVIFRGRASWGRSLGRHLFILLGVLLLGLILSSPQWMPFAEYLSLAWSYHAPGAGLRHLDMAYLISLILPWFFGENWLSTLVPFLACGLGIVPVILAVRACLDFRRSSAIIFFLVMAVILAGIIYGIPPFSLLGHVFPFSLAYNYKYSQSGLALCAAMLAAVGLEMLAEEADHKRSIAAGLFVFMLVAVSLIMALLDLFSPYFGFGARPGIIQVSAVILAIAVLLVFKERLAWPGPLFKASVLLVSIIALVPDFTGRNPRFDTYLLGQVKEGEKLAEMSEEPFRFSAEDEIFFPNLLLPVRVADLRSYDPLYPVSYVELMAMLNELEGEDVREHYDRHMLFQVDRENVGSPLAALCNLKLFAVRHEISSIPMSGVFQDKSDEIGPFAGWSRVKMVQVDKNPGKALLHHAPGMVRAPLPRRTRGLRLAFSAAHAGMMEAGESEEDGEKDREGEADGDGLFMLAFLSGDEGRSLMYARLFEPFSRPGDDDWKHVEVPFPGTGFSHLELCALPGPKNILQGDLAAWAEVRLKGGREKTRFERLNPDGEVPGFYQNMGVLPRAFFVPGYSVLPGPGREEKLDKIKTLYEKWPDVFKYQVLMMQDVSPEMSGERISERSPGVGITGYSSDRVELACRVGGPGFVVLSDQYFPGWRAFTKKPGGHAEKETRIYEADIAVRAVAVESGESIITFKYMPWSFRIGLFGALASGLAGIMAMFIRRLSQ